MRELLGQCFQKGRQLEVALCPVWGCLSQTSVSYSQILRVSKPVHPHLLCQVQSHVCLSSICPSHWPSSGAMVHGGGKIRENSY